MRKIFKLSLWNIGHALVLFILFSFLWLMYEIAHVMDISRLGFPLAFYISWGHARQGKAAQNSKDCSSF